MKKFLNNNGSQTRTRAFDILIRCKTAGNAPRKRSAGRPRAKPRKGKHGDGLLARAGYAMAAGKPGKGNGSRLAGSAALLRGSGPGLIRRHFC
jgi:hypothetical protein